MHFPPDLLALLNAFAPFSLLGHVNESTQFFYLYLFKSLFSMYSICSGINEHTDIHSEEEEKAILREAVKFMEVEVVFSSIQGLFQTFPERTSCLLLFFSQSSCRVFFGFLLM